MKRVDKLTHRNRCQPARAFRVYPDPRLPYVVEVRIARHRRHMREEMLRLDNKREQPEVQGLVRSWHIKKDPRRPAVRPRMVVARMYLNVRDMRARPSEIVSHECTHAGMAFARVRRANLNVMDGEEILAHAVGQLVRQINSICFAHGVWP